MEVIELYPASLRFAEGKGAWKALFPLRFVMAAVYGLVARMAGAVARAAGGRPLVARHGGGAPFVVSVGNLEAGGGGKTPCVIALSAGIRERGGTPVVISRGFRSAVEGRGPFVIGGAAAPGVLTSAESAGAPYGSSASLAGRFGDEIVLYRARGIPVVVDANRRRGAELAVDLFAPTHILLDDGYQHHSLAKDLDILLLDAERPFGNGFLLPAGRLREAPAAARRAGAIIFTRSREERVPDAAKPYAAGKAVLFARHEPVCLLDREGGRKPLSTLLGRDVIAFSGIARPEPFEILISSLGAAVRAAVRFEDHHRYTRADVERVLKMGRAGTLFITTEKDFAKVAESLPPGAAVHAIEIEMKIAGFEQLLPLLGLAP